jgi:hypothetical protein
MPRPDDGNVQLKTAKSLRRLGSTSAVVHWLHDHKDFLHRRPLCIINTIRHIQIEDVRKAVLTCQSTKNAYILDRGEADDNRIVYNLNVGLGVRIGIGSRQILQDRITKVRGRVISLEKGLPRFFVVEEIGYRFNCFLASRERVKGRVSLLCEFVCGCAKTGRNRLGMGADHRYAVDESGRNEESKTTH